jgi:hypothetical protein
LRKACPSGVGWGHNRRNCFYVCLYRKNVFIPSHNQVWKGYNITVCMYDCVCDGLWRDLRRTQPDVALSVLIFHILLLHYKGKNSIHFHVKGEIFLKILHVQFPFKPNKTSQNNRLDLFPFGYYGQLEIIDWLITVLPPAQEFFTYMETLPLPVWSSVNLYQVMILYSSRNAGFCLEPP